jgi:glycosyltransferase involved in cell wall biosynthesis
MYDLSLIVLTKNEEKKIGHMLSSVVSIVKEIIVIDTGSTDNTLNIVKKYAPKAQIHKIEFTNFSSLLNTGISYCKSKWILFLDADEYILPEHLPLFEPLLNQTTYDCFLIPRHHWYNLEMTKEYTTPYPDRQTRLFLNSGKVKYIRYVHCGIEGVEHRGIVDNGLHIQHFNTYYDTPDDFGRKDRFYKGLIAKEKEERSHRMDKTAATNILLELKSILDKFHITFFLLAGTCLGAVRNNDFIGDDRDMDLGFYELPHFGDVITKELIEKGYEFHPHRGKNPILPLYKNGFRVDFIKLSQNNEIYYFYSNNTMQIKVFPNSMFDTLDTVTFLGVTFCVPHTPQEYLKLSYGNWEIPDEDGRCGNIVLSETPDVLRAYINKGIFNTKDFGTTLCK